VLRLPNPEPGYNWACLEGGPLDGEIILVPVEAHRFNLPATLIGVLAPVLDEDAETLAWEPVSYLCSSRQGNRPNRDVWVYVSAGPPDRP
jgi:hypothetical protein